MKTSEFFKAVDELKKYSYYRNGNLIVIKSKISGDPIAGVDCSVRLSMQVLFESFNVDEKLFDLVLEYSRTDPKER